MPSFRDRGRRQGCARSAAGVSGGVGGGGRGGTFGYEASAESELSFAISECSECGEVVRC